MLIDLVMTLDLSFTSDFDSFLREADRLSAVTHVTDFPGGAKDPESGLDIPQLNGYMKS